MKTIFDENVRTELISRIYLINKSNIAKWGKMNVFQMVKHNTFWNCWILGKDNPFYEQTYLGKLFGKIALNKMIKNEKPLDKSIPTSDQFKVHMKIGDLEAEKAEWISLINEYEKYNNPKFIHDFFGKMTIDEVGILVYKHTDHHLRQFGL